MKTELCWMVVPITGLLSQIGGTWWKASRRFLIPIIMATTWVVFAGWSWAVPAMMVCQWGAFTLPVTLKGDSVPNNGWFNWVWLYIKGILTSLSPLVFNLDLWPITVILGLTYGLMVTLSNIPATAKYFQWKLVELFHGMFPLIVLCFAITL